MDRPVYAPSRLQPSVELSAKAAHSLKAGPLNRLSRSEIARLLAVASRVRLTPRQALSHGETPMEHIYFIETGLVSVMAKAGKNRWVEAWMVGPSVFVGMPTLLTDGGSAYRRIVQIGGSALSIPVHGFRPILQSSGNIQALALEHFASRLLQASQIGACNAQHSAMERVSRWLLLASHELCANCIAVSHESIARALGLRRATVSDCLKQLDARRAVRTYRRMIEIADADALQSCSCDCYRIISRGCERYANAASFL